MCICVHINVCVYASTRYSRIEIERIIGQPFSSLTRQEMAVKKLLSKFHDNPEMVRRAMGSESHGFDAHLAERTRIKNERGMTEEEREWMSIDTILHPEVLLLPQLQLL